ncbi:MAG: hypothetical protein HY901_32605 [Deltaproteobacteria bacterium]|nr:hypothetical protein [Deltaproteobacteria bacterium]
MRRLLLVIVPVVVASCSWSDLDAEFLAAMPQRADLKVIPPTQVGQQQQGLGSSDDLGTRQDELQSEKFQGLNDTAAGLNTMIDGLTGGLDTVRQVPPSLREPERRVWGPYPDKDHPGLDIQVAIVHGPDAYAYSAEWRKQGTQDGFEAVITGNFKGEKAKGGSGEFTLDMDKARSIGVARADDPGSKDWRTLTLTYDHGAEATDVWLTQLLVAGAQLDYHHSRGKDGSGSMAYKLDKEDLFSKWTLLVQARWLASRAGVLSAIAKNERDPLAPVGHYAECWSDSLDLVYRSQDYADQQCARPLECEVGEVGNCAIAPP